MDGLRLLRDYSVPHVTEGHKHCRQGWVNMACPFCTGNPGYHLGWNINNEYFVCYRCGSKPPIKTFSALLSMSIPDVLTILPTYGVNRSAVYVKPKDKLDFRFPTGVTELLPHHKKYLEKRGYDPSELIKLWDIKSIGRAGSLDKIQYTHRVLIPFKWNGEDVSFDTRDVTGKDENKYKACPIQREKVEHKNILYGNQEAWGHTGIIVEGPTDVWRLGERAAATSGIKYKTEQVNVIARSFKRGSIVFDDEPQAQVQAKKLVRDLKNKGCDFTNIKIKGDPGNLSEKDAKELVKYILNKK